MEMGLDRYSLTDELRTAENVGNTRRVYQIHKQLGIRHSLMKTIAAPTAPPDPSREREAWKLHLIKNCKSDAKWSKNRFGKMSKVNLQLIGWPMNQPQRKSISAQNKCEMVKLQERMVFWQNSINMGVVSCRNRSRV